MWGALGFVDHIKSPERDLAMTRSTIYMFATYTQIGVGLHGETMLLIILMKAVGFLPRLVGFFLLFFFALGFYVPPPHHHQIKKKMIDRVLSGCGR